MKITSNSKIFFNILGLNCSGTTIIAKFFDSLENGFCLSEPLHRPERQNADFIAELKNEFKESDYLIGGLKEVFVNNSGYDRFAEIEKYLSLFDLNLVVLRNPFSNIGSILPKAAKNRSIESLFRDVVESYERLFEFIRVNNCVVISYEKFCEHPAPYLNSLFPHDIQIVGPVFLAKDYQNYTIGNKIAKLSTQIKSPLDRSSRLSAEQKRVIERRIWPRYQELI